jgi:uncharacterized OsmC-like protein
LARYASILKTTITSAECHVEFDWFLSGSVLAGTVQGGASACRTHFVVDSPDPEDEVLRVIRLAKQGCFAEQMVQTAVPLTSTYIVNGRDVAVSLGSEPQNVG